MMRCAGDLVNASHPAHACDNVDRMKAAVIQDLDALKERLAPHLRKARIAIVFGSVARGEADEWSDLDLVIVADTTRPFLDRFRDFEGIYDVWPRLDLLIYTPEEFSRMRAEGRPFIQHVLDEGAVMYEASPAG
jgi:predicted nucleotidyltransferase